MKGFELACAVPWAIREDALRTILDIAARVHLDGDTLEALEARRGEPLDNTRTVDVRDGVAIVPVSGPIFRHAGLFSRISGATSTAILARDITTAADDPAIKGILLNVDSPGGEVAGIEELAAMIRDVAKRKPVAAYVDGMAASAAYWIAAAAGRVVIAPTGMVGSIGVVATHRDTKEMDAKLGVKTTEIVSSQSPRKRPDVTTDAGRAQVQAQVDQLAAVFIDRVAAYRTTTAAKVKSDFGGGDILIGAAARKAGMADRVSNFETTLSDLAAGRIGRVRSVAPPPVKDSAMATDWRENFLARLFGMGPAAADESADDEDNEELLRRAAGTLRTTFPLKRSARVKSMATDDDTLDLPAPDPEKEELKRQVAALQARQVQGDAASFADDLIRSGKALPAERADLVTVFTRAALDDASLPAKVSFADAANKATEGTRVEALKALYSRRPSHQMTDDLLPSQRVVLSNDADDPDGTAILAERIKQANAGRPTPAR